MLGSSGRVVMRQTANLVYVGSSPAWNSIFWFVAGEAT